MSCQIMSCHIMSYHVISCHVMSCHGMSCHAMPCHVMSCHVISICLSVCLSVCLSIHPSIHPSIHQSIHPSIPSINPSIHPFIKMITEKTGALSSSHRHWFLTKCSKPIQRLPYYLPNIVVILINICLILCTKAIDFSLFILSGPILQKRGQILQGNGLCRFSRTIPNLWVAAMRADQQSNRGQECHAQWSKEYLFNWRFEENHVFRSAGGRGRLRMCFYQHFQTGEWWSCISKTKDPCPRRRSPNPSPAYDPAVDLWANTNAMEIPSIYNPSHVPKSSKECIANLLTKCLFFDF